MLVPMARDLTLSSKFPFSGQFKSRRSRADAARARRVTA